MRLFPLNLSLLLALPAGAPPVEPGAALTPRQIAASESGAVVQIAAQLGDHTSQGSGFVADPSGLIVTNLHVLDGATAVKVSLPDGRRFDEVSVLAFDVEQDLAVAHVELPEGSAPLPAGHLGKSASVKPGDAIVVISNPLGLTLTVTDGIVSAWREPQHDGFYLDSNESATMLPLPTRRLLQISAPISPGSSGGPVFNDRAEVIGVSIAGMLYGMADLNFAVPADEIPAMLRRDAPMDLRTFQRRVASARADLARPYFETALLSYEQGEAGAAMKHLRRALLLFPAFENALLLAGRIRMEAGDLGQAEQLFLKAVEANEENTEAWYRLATLYDVMSADNASLTLVARAQSAYERALALDERHAGAAFGLALLQVRRGNLAEAEALLRSATEHDSSMAAAHAILGLILLERARLDEAEAAFKRAIWQDAGSALPYFGLARIAMIEDNTRGTASGYWEKFLQLSAGDPSLAREREVALRIVERYFPELIRR